MYRLTERINGYAHGTEGKHLDKLTGNMCRGEFEATACVEMLADYEDTGFEPEQVTELHNHAIELENRMTAMDKAYRELAEKYAELEKENEWIPTSERLPKCRPRCETGPISYQMKETETVEMGYFGTAGKLRDNYFRTYRDVLEGVDASDVIAWRTIQPYKESDKQ